ALGPPAYSADGKLLAVPSREVVLFFDAETGRRVRSVGGFPHFPFRVAFSPAGDLLAVADSRGFVTLVGAERGKPVHTLPGRKGNREAAPRLAFSSDGKLVAVGYADEEWIRVRDTRTGKVRAAQDFPGERAGGGIDDLAF